MDCNEGLTLTKIFDIFVPFDRLAHRKPTFRKMIEHLDRYEDGIIVETGTTRIKDNWEGDGQSTLIWDWVCSNKPMYQAHSVDLDENAVNTAKAAVKHVQVHHSDSLKFLNEFPKEKLPRLRLLYLDSFDWSQEIHMDSCFHAMSELATVWSHIPSGCMIAIDDRHNQFAGKHMMVMFFMEKLGVEPVFADYQIGWVKP